MADINLEFGRFLIIPHTDGNLPIGVNVTKPAFQDVYVNAPVRLWRLRKVGHNRYLLSIDGYPYTGVVDGKVAASTHIAHEVVWGISHQVYHNASTISLADDPGVGWTTNEDTGKIELHPIAATHSEPPQFSRSQLFSFKFLQE